ncbi:MAG TPA: hypothetical protein VKJ01_15030 [Candidatus Solibacter sp.]|nr:hypothetical protein [Candidatus Solibacter sp.]
MEGAGFKKYNQTGIALAVQRIQFRLGASNVGNHPVFNPPGTAFGSSSFGQISGTKIGSRAVQLGLKYFF